MDVFQDDEDRRVYLQLLAAEQAARYGLRFLAYCLMSNHAHLIVIPSEEHSLSRGLGEAHRRYTTYVNLRDGVRGYLFQGRFYSCPLDERHLVAAARYVERNPVRAGLVRYAWDYACSKHPASRGALQA